ncbi:MAG: TonB-dependent receptor [Edaphocola sp.]
MARLVYISLVSFLLLLAATNLRAQTNSGAPHIGGKLQDTVNLTPTGYASVALIRASDSMLQTFGRSAEDGSFRMSAPDTGRYLLLVAHPSFAIYIDELKAQGANVDLGTIVLTSKKQMLDEVVVTDAKAIVIKGDTIEYNADSFKTSAFDNVDELLKKLPGIEIGKDGKIKAYGKEVKHMTVDGEEFFSDDPAIVAKTLRASAVDKVQVFDKKSDQAAFTGIDDGETSKTINLKLKDDAKKGYFGKIGVSGGLPSYWENQAMINAFKKKRKISAFGIMANTNTTGLDWENGNKYGSGNQSVTQDDDGNWIATSQSDEFGGWDGRYTGQGLPKTWTGGAQYTNKWLNDSLSFSGNYKYNNNVVEGANNSRTQYILPDTQYYYNNQANSTLQRQRHGARATSEYLIDSTSSVKLSVNGSVEKRRNHNAAYSESVATSGQLINDNNSNTRTEINNYAGNAELLYRKRFKKKGRTVSAMLNGDWSSSHGNGTQFSDYNLYSIDSSYNINQFKETNNSGLTGKLRVAYTEPITNNLNLEIAYNFGLNNNQSKLSSYDVNDTNGHHTGVFNPQFSADYVFDNMQHTGSATLRYSVEKRWSAFAGMAASNNGFRQQDYLFDTSYRYSFFNLLPRVGFTWRKSQMSSVRFSYNTGIKPPSISQLQPLRNNTDPLNITLGNPNLKQTYRHSLSLSYNAYKMLSSRNIYCNVYFTINQNDVTATQYVDEAARRTTNYVNVNGNYNGGGYADYGRKFGDVYASISGSAAYSHTNNFTNGLANTNDNFSVTPRLNGSYEKDTTLSIRFSFSPSYNSNRSSIATSAKNKYWTFQQQLDATCRLPFKMEIGTDIDWNIRQRLDPQDKNNNVLSWNAHLSKTFLKDRSLALRFDAHDILNQNQGFDRYNTATQISETTYNTIRRYFMLGLTWNFTKTGSKAKGADAIETDRQD